MEVATRPLSLTADAFQKVTKCTKGMKKYPDVRKLRIGMENDGLATPRDGFF